MLIVSVCSGRLVVGVYGGVSFFFWVFLWGGVVVVVGGWFRCFWCEIGLACLSGCFVECLIEPLY